jgi:hypothetical protein
LVKKQNHVKTSAPEEQHFNKTDTSSKKPKPCKGRHFGKKTKPRKNISSRGAAL